MIEIGEEIKRLLKACEKIAIDQAEIVELAAEHQCAFCGAFLSLGEGGVVQGHRIDCEWDCILTTLPEMLDTLEKTRVALREYAHREHYMVHSCDFADCPSSKCRNNRAILGEETHEQTK